MDIESALQHYQDIESIKTLKYRYIRFMTQSNWDQMEKLLTEDVETSYSDGKFVFNDRNELMNFLRSSTDRDESDAISYWQVGMPEIEFLSDTKARGIWGMYHFYLDKSADQQLEMFCYYSDEYVKSGGEWKICKTGYERIMEQTLDRKATHGYNLTVG
jgi:hypothetical protein